MVRWRAACGLRGMVVPLAFLASLALQPASGASTALQGASVAVPRRPWSSVRQRLPSQASPRPSAANCTWVYVEQPLSHFAPGAGGGGTYRQRLCVYDAYWGGAAAGAPIFFYVGNESPLDEYVNNTGLMWEAAPDFKALLVWAEHRYFGESVPKLGGAANCLAWLSSEEALADYASVLETFRADAAWRWHAPRSPVIAFGGSYGGMLAAWFRMKYSSHVNGAISASAPIWGFPRSVGELDGSAAQLSNAALPAGGAPAACVPNMKAAWVLISDLAKTPSGRRLISESMGLCDSLGAAEDAVQLLDFLQGPLFNLAEGSYPFATDYITYATDNGTTAPLPAWPMRKVCEPLASDFNVSLQGDVGAVRFEVHAGSAVISVDWDQAKGNGYDVERDLAGTGVPSLLEALAQGLQVWYNVTGTSRCLDWRSGQPQPAASVGGSRGQGGVRDEAAKERGGPLPAGSGAEPSAPVCGDVHFGPDLAWGALTCNDGMNLVNTVVHGFGRDLYWPPSHRRNVTLAEVVNGSMSFCGQYEGMGLYGVPQQPDEWGVWMDTNYGGRAIGAHTNIFFSNGQLDPWTAGGVPPPGPSHELQASLISLGGHHLDLFFATEDDPASVRSVRETERKLIAQWIGEARAAGAEAVIV